MTLEHFIDTYGYVAILIGTFLEGETTLILGGVTAKLGYLELQWVIACAFIGTLAGDQLFFFIGRYHGAAYLRRHTSWNKRIEKADRILQRHRILIIVGFRFLYGLRIIMPIAIGMSKIPIAAFVVLNVFGAALWAVVIGVLGYVFGHAVDLFVGDIRRYELEVLAAVLAIGLSVWLIHIVWSRKSRKTKQ